MSGYEQRADFARSLSELRQRVALIASPPSGQAAAIHAQNLAAIAVSEATDRMRQAWVLADAARLRPELLDELLRLTEHIGELCNLVSSEAARG